MKVTFSLGTLILTLLLDSTVSKKYHVGPCIYVTDSEPCPDPEFIQVYLYTRKNTEEGKQVEISEKTDNLKSSNFNPKNPNKIIIHGFNTDIYVDVLQDIKTEYLKMGDVNVWMVNYPNLVRSPWCYVSAAKNIGHVGKCLVQLVTALRRHQSDQIHVIGFSLGGQVPNYIATNLPGEKLDRITGLDPAGPLFTLMKENSRLDPSDAKFVDVIHTNGGLQGDIQRCGHIDFYMNGGVSQPGCFNNKKQYLNCNHRRAPIYFAESINSKVGFFGWKCSGYMEYIEGKCKPKAERVIMGEHCPNGSSGIHIAPTASKKPFALGNKTNEKLELRRFQNNTELVLIEDPLQRVFKEYDTFLERVFKEYDTFSERVFKEYDTFLERVFKENDIVLIEE